METVGDWEEGKLTVEMTDNNQKKGREKNLLDIMENTTYE